MIIWPWLLLLAAGLVLEGVAIANKKDRLPTLSEAINKYVPPAMIASGIAWLAWHFGVDL